MEYFKKTFIVINISFVLNFIFLHFFDLIHFEYQNITELFYHLFINGIFIKTNKKITTKCCVFNHFHPNKNDYHYLFIICTITIYQFICVNLLLFRIFCDRNWNFNISIYYFYKKYNNN